MVSLTFGMLAAKDKILPLRRKNLRTKSCQDNFLTFSYLAELHMLQVLTQMACEAFLDIPSTLAELKRFDHCPPDPGF